MNRLPAPVAMLIVVIAFLYSVSPAPAAKAEERYPPGTQIESFDYVALFPGTTTASAGTTIAVRPNGAIDNGNQFYFANGRGSRGVEYALDETARTATLVREYRTTPAVVAVTHTLPIKLYYSWNGASP